MKIKNPALIVLAALAAAGLAAAAGTETNAPETNAPETNAPAANAPAASTNADQSAAPVAHAPPATNAPDIAESSDAAEIPPTNAVRMNFHDAPLNTVLNYLSKRMGFVIVSDAEVRGTVTIVSEQPVGTNEVHRIAQRRAGQKQLQRDTQRPVPDHHDSGQCHDGSSDSGRTSRFAQRNPDK